MTDGTVAATSFNVSDAFAFVLKMLLLCGEFDHKRKVHP
jgi:hypothetical protein